MTALIVVLWIFAIAVWVPKDIAESLVSAWPGRVVEWLADRIERIF